MLGDKSEGSKLWTPRPIGCSEITSSSFSTRSGIESSSSEFSVSSSSLTEVYVQTTAYNVSSYNCYQLYFYEPLRSLLCTKGKFGLNQQRYRLSDETISGYPPYVRAHCTAQP